MGHRWGDTTYAEDMGVLWEECPGNLPEDFYRPRPSITMHRLTDTNGEELVERALRERRGKIP